ncbi:MAG: GDP-mannose 4,6-dehydratase [Marmoricola sp.]|jgi:UDP-glucose 4-epimerase|nr:GDP-mannose 4,6-dehydratase [Marmoricola sp.]
MRVAITGGAGFIGANLARHLLDRGAEITVLDDLSTGYERNIAGLDLEFVEGSILDDHDLEALNDADAIVHLAALPSVPRSIENPLLSHEVNATGSLRVLEKARARGAHVILASSSSVYGANPILPKVESMRPMPLSPYAVSKLAAESYALAHQQVFGLPTLAFRFFNVYGPLQAPGHAYAAVVPAFTHAAVTGTTLVVHGDGKQTRDFTFVGTVVAAIGDALERRVTSTDPVNLAFGTRHSLLDVVALLEDMLDRAVPLEHVGTRAGDVRDSQADSTLITSLFGSVEPTELRDGLAQTVAWMQEYIA